MKSKKQYEVVDTNNNVIGNIREKREPFFGTYWYCYADVPMTEIPLSYRSNTELLLSLSPSALRMYIIILHLLNQNKGSTSEIVLSQQVVNDVLESVACKEGAGSGSMSKNTYYAAIKELIKINFIKHLKVNYYKVNANYLYNKKDKTAERW